MDLDVAQPSSAKQLVFAGSASLAVLLVTGWLWVENPGVFADPDAVLISRWWPAPITAGVTAAVAVFAVLTAAFFLLRPASFATRAAVRVGVAAVPALAFGLLLQSNTSIALAGYLVAMALPLALLVLVVQAVRRYPRLRLPVLAILAGLLTLGVSSGSLSGAALHRLGAEMAAGFVRSGPRLLLSLAVTTGALGWFALSWTAWRSGPRYPRVAAAVVRHRVAFTVIAALGPVPYALARLTWLTPWPQFSPAAAELSPEMRLWGVLLGGAAVLGSVLTIGLIRPWGERFPRWMPGLAGRAVPVAAAAGPGGVVAAVLCVCAIPMVITLGFPADGQGVGGLGVTERVLTALVFPLWLWGPMLALAVWGYVGHRRTTAPATTSPTTAPTAAPTGRDTPGNPAGIGAERLP